VRSLQLLLAGGWLAASIATHAAAAQTDPADASAAPAMESAAAAPNARPLLDYELERTAERIERGRYLSEHLLQCFVCHSERDWNAPGAPPVEARKGAGAIYSQSGERVLVAPNITPDPETGAGSWTDDMLARAIREGIGHDGRPLHPAMWYRSFAFLSDEDLASVVVYVRTLPPVRNDLPATTLPSSELAEISALPKPIASPVADPPADDELARGRYLITVADCEGCHTAWAAPRMPGLLAGGNEIVRGERTAFSTNITTHGSGVGYPGDAFVAIMQTGKGGELSPLMPWAAFRGLTAADLLAMHRTLGEVAPVWHFVSNSGEKQQCAVCGQQHPLGSLNRLETPVARVTMDVKRLESLAGRYYASIYDETITVRRAGNRLYARLDDGTEIELIPETGSRFLAPGLLTPLDFVIGDDGRANEIVLRDLQRTRFVRVD
jgi:mono/diheme cytochrome c family protein